MTGVSPSQPTTESVAQTINRCFMMAWDEFGDDASTEFIAQITACRLGIDPADVYDALAECNDDDDALQPEKTP